MNLRQIDFWKNHEDRVLSVLRSALRRLALRPGLLRNEGVLNRELYWCICEAIREYVNAGGEFPGCVMYEASNQPHCDDVVRASREDKRPDLQFAVMDHQESDAHASAKQFVVECKRVGDSGSSSWVLNRNYVLNGIGRFRDPSFGYGKGTPSGAMIGYIENTSAEEVVAEILPVLSAEGLEALAIEVDGDVREMNQTVHRTDEPKSYKIRHLWLTLASYQWN